MKQLIGIRLVQFFLYEKRDIPLGRFCGVFGANGSGKSSLLDAVQIVMLGASARRGSGVVFNAQADESNSNTRSIRSYCLGQYGDSDTSRVREDATTYITLVWLDTDTRELVSTGVCISASSQRDEHDVLGRYIFRSDLTLNDHLELVDGEERPRDWGAFREQLRQRSAAGDEVLFHDSDRFVKAMLLQLRGSQGTAQLDAYRQAFRFGLRMRFDQSIDHIVRQQVLEAKPTNIQRFKEVFAGFKDLAGKVAGVKAKLEKAGGIDKFFDDAERRARHAVTWIALGRACASEGANESLTTAEAAEGEAQGTLESSKQAEATATFESEQASASAASAASKRDQHASHADKELLESLRAGATERAESKRREIRMTLGAVAALLTRCVDSRLVPASSQAATAANNALSQTLAGETLPDKAELARVSRQSLKAATAAASELFLVRSGIARELTEARESIRAMEENRARVGGGKAALDSNVAKLKGLLGDAGVDAVPVCDLVRIDDPAWQPVIEGYLGPANLQALLVNEDSEGEAFGVYRRSAVYGAKVVMPSRYEQRRSPPSGAVAELIRGDSVAAVNFLRAKFGDAMRAESDKDFFAHRSALTKDGMLLAAGDLDRIRPVPAALFKIGSVSSNAVTTLDADIRKAKTELRGIEARDERAKTLYDSLSPFAGPVEARVAIVVQLSDDATSEDAEAKRHAARLVELDTAEYRQLVALAVSTAETARVRQIAATDAAVARGRAEAALASRQEATGVAKQNQQAAAAAASRARQAEGFNADYFVEQWDKLLATKDVAFASLVEACETRAEAARRDSQAKINSAQQGLTEYFLAFQDEFLPAERREDWRSTAAWLKDRIAFLDGTRLKEYEAQMASALDAARSTFRNDVAVALNERLEWLKHTFDRMNDALRAAPAFTNGERYLFRRTTRPAHAALLKFVQDVAEHGPVDDLLGGAGDMPNEFEQLMKDKAGAESRAERSPLDDYREFFDFDVEVVREDSTTGIRRTVGFLSKRVGSGSGGEHRAPLYVMAGAAIASAYRLERGNDSGLRLLLLDEAFVKMDPRNITATMRYFEELGLQIFMASTGDALGTLTAFLDRYYDIMRDAELNVVLLEGHSIDAATRELFRSDLPEFHPELIDHEVSQMFATTGALPAAAGALG